VFLELGRNISMCDTTHQLVLSNVLIYTVKVYVYCSSVCKGRTTWDDATCHSLFLMTKYIHMSKSIWQPNLKASMQISHVIEFRVINKMIRDKNLINFDLSYKFIYSAKHLGGFSPMNTVIPIAFFQKIYCTLYIFGDFIWQHV